jgi:hypothetical protein
MVLYAAIAIQFRKDNHKRDHERGEEGQEEIGRGAAQWIKDDNKAEEMLMNETVPVRQEWDRLVLKTRKAKHNEPEELNRGSTPQRQEHCTKEWSGTDRVHKGSSESP